jgi:hypothetical protein
MAHPQPVVTESTEKNNDLSGPLILGPSRYEMSASISHAEYLPLPPGRWTLNFHGNCPRCHHHHNGARIKVDTTLHDNQVSYVECERCRDKWAAFGGSNATRISLLSAASSEPDVIEGDFRKTLIDMVKNANAHPLPETPPKPTSPGLRPPTQGSTNNKPQESLSSQKPLQSFAYTGGGDLIEPGREPRDHEFATSPVTENPTVVKRRRGTIKLLSKLTAKIRSRLPKLHQDTAGKHLAGSYKQPKLSARQLEKSPAQIISATDDQNVSAELPHIISGTLDGLDQASKTMDDLDVAGPSTRMAEVGDFVPGFDMPVLGSMTMTERIRWMREQYRSFKTRNKKAPVRLEMPPSAHEPQPLNQSLSRTSIEILGIGSQIEGQLESLEDGLRRGSTTIGLSTFSAFDTAHELTSELWQRPRAGLIPRRPHSLNSITRSLSCSRSNSLCSVRPQSVRSSRFQSLRGSRRRAFRPRLRQRMRSSYDSLVNGGGGTSSIRAQKTTRMSQNTTLNSSTFSIDREGSRDVSIAVPGSNLSVVSIHNTSSPMPGPEPIAMDREIIFDLILGSESSATDTKTVPDLVPSPDPTFLENSIPDLLSEQSGAHEVPNNANIQSHGSSSNPNQGAAPPSNTHVGDNPTAGSGGPSGSKRPRKEPPNDNNDTHRRKRKQRLDDDRDESSPKLFACPFPKYDPMKHTGCWGFTFQKDRFGDLR